MSCYTPNFTYLCAIRQIWKTEQARHRFQVSFPSFPIALITTFQLPIYIVNRQHY